MYQLRYNSRTFHIEGMTGRTCGTLTRYMDTLARGAQTFDDLGAAVRNARIAARVNNMRVCGNCEEYAEKALSETDRNAQHYVNTLQSLDAGTDVQLYTFDGHTLAGVIADHGPEALTMTSVQGDPITVAYVDIESFEFYDEAAENWVDPVAEAHAAAPDATLTAAVRHFVCLSCGATDETAKCTYTGSSAHRSPRRMLPGDFQRYMASRRPVDKEAAAARREAIRATRTHLAARAEEAAAATDPLSPTAQAVVAIGDARDEAMRAAYEAEGTAALAADGSCVERFTHDAIGYACYLGADAHDVHESSTGLRWIAGKSQPVHCPVSDCAACEETAAALVAQLPAAAWELTPEAAALAARIGAALVGDTDPEPDTNEGPRMAKFQVSITQVVNTTVYVEAPDREAAVELAVGELPELCLQCAGGGPKESPQVSEVNRYVNDYYDEPEVTELDEYGCAKKTGEDDAAALTAAAAATVPELDEVNADNIVARHSREGRIAHRAYTIAAAAYWYAADHYARTGTRRDLELAGMTLGAFHAAAAAAAMCAAIGIDWACDRTRVDGHARCADHLVRLDAREGSNRG